jgi:hypothetical protein
LECLAWILYPPAQMHVIVFMACNQRWLYYVVNWNIAHGLIVLKCVYINSYGCDLSILYSGYTCLVSKSRVFLHLPPSPIQRWMLITWFLSDNLATRGEELRLRCWAPLTPLVRKRALSSQQSVPRNGTHHQLESAPTFRINKFTAAPHLPRKKSLFPCKNFNMLLTKVKILILKSCSSL